MIVVRCTFGLCILTCLRRCRWAISQGIKSSLIRLRKEATQFAGHQPRQQTGEEELRHSGWLVVGCFGGWVLWWLVVGEEPVGSFLSIPVGALAGMEKKGVDGPPASATGIP